MRAMEPRISSARREVASHLAATLEAALGGRHAAAALHCLHAYAELGEPGPAEVRQVVWPGCDEGGEGLRGERGSVA